MSLSYRIDPESRVVMTDVEGTVSLDEIRGHFSRMRADPAFDPSFARLVDMRRLKGVGFELDRLLDVALLFSEGVEGQRTRTALVAGPSNLFDLARGFEMLTTRMGFDVAVFRDLAAAREWLGLEGA